MLNNARDSLFSGVVFLTLRRYWIWYPEVDEARQSCRLGKAKYPFDCGLSDNQTAEKPSCRASRQPYPHLHHCQPSCIPTVDNQVFRESQDNISGLAYKNRNFRKWYTKQNLWGPTPPSGYGFPLQYAGKRDWLQEPAYSLWLLQNRQVLWLSA